MISPAPSVDSSKKPSALRETLADWVRSGPREGVVLVVAQIGMRRDGTAEGGAVTGRLSDLGLAPGETFEYFGRAPLGEPVFICVRETVLALRIEEAALIEIVRPAP